MRLALDQAAEVKGHKVEALIGSVDQGTDVPLPGKFDKSTP